MMSAGSMIAFNCGYDFFIASLISALFTIRSIDPKPSGDSGEFDRVKPELDRAKLTPTDEEAKDFKRL